MKKLIALILVLLAVLACDQEPDPQEEPLKVQSVSLTIIDQTRDYDSLHLHVKFQGTGTACMKWYKGRRNSENPFELIRTEYWNVDTDIDPTSDIFTSSGYLWVAKFGDRPYQMYVEVHRLTLDLNDTTFTLLTTSNTITGRVHHSY